MLKDSSRVQGDSFEDSGSVRKGHNPYQWVMWNFSDHYHMLEHQFGKLSVAAFLKITLMPISFSLLLSTHPSLLFHVKKFLRKLSALLGRKTPFRAFRTNVSSPLSTQSIISLSNKKL